MNSIEAMLKLINRSFLVDHDRKKPGEVIRRAPKEIREAIQELTSKDLNKIRVEF